MTVPSTHDADRIVARHHTSVLGTDVSFCLSTPADLPRRMIGEGLAAAVAELRAVEAAFSPFRPRSLVNAVRRGELTLESYPPPLLDVVQRCAQMRAATDGWFDAWAGPGGFDPSGLIKGWAVDRAAALLRRAGIDDFALRAGADRLVHGLAPQGTPWRVGVADPGDPLRRTALVEITEGALAIAGTTHRELIIDPHTGAPSTSALTAAVAGPQLAVANAYAVGLCAAGESGLTWFPTADGYDAMIAEGRPVPPAAQRSLNRAPGWNSRPTRRALMAA